MREFRFNASQPAPVVSALLVGPNATRKVKLIFDTGAALTQFHEPTINKVGYSVKDKFADCVSSGTAGNPDQGYLIKASKLFVLGAKATDVPIGVFQMSNLEEDAIDGLLGWDLIREFHLEMNGPEGILRIF